MVIFILGSKTLNFHVIPKYLYKQSWVLFRDEHKHITRTVPFPLFPLYNKTIYATNMNIGAD